MLNFQARLINVKFDKENRNVLRFSTRETQQKYFDVASLFNDAPLVNFNAGNLLNTTITYIIQDNESINDILSKNYCIIKDNTPNATLRYYYYHIEDIVQDSGNQVKVRMKLDIFQTYYIDINFTECEIKRAHINRFVDIGDNNIKFDDSNNSPLFLAEVQGEASKRLIKMEPLRWNITNNTDIDNWLNDNVAYWVYIFIDKTHNYTSYALDGTKSTTGTGGNSWWCETEGSNANNVSNDYGVLCYPVYKKTLSILKSIKLKYNDKLFIVNQQAFNDFRDNNSDTSFVYSRKISLMPPFRTNNTTRFSIVDGELIINFSNATSGTINPIITDNVAFGLGQCRAMITNYQSYTAGNTALFGGITQPSTPLSSYPISLDYPLTFVKTDIIGAQNNKIYNPKLLNADTLTIKLKSFDGTTFDYDLQKIGTNSFSFIYNETIQPEITKYYCRLSGENGLYVEDTQISLLGLVGSTDTTIAISNDQYKSYLANNKNFWLQSNFKIANNSVRDIGQSVVAGSERGLLGGVVNSIVGAGQQLFDRYLSIDNLRQSPDALQRAAGNILFSSQIKDITIYVEIHQAIDAILMSYNNYNILYGFAINKIDSIKNYDNIRKYYNYIQASIEEITGIPISNAVHDEFKKAFSQGVRFWNTDTFSYENENYENWLEEET